MYKYTEFKCSFFFPLTPIEIYPLMYNKSYIEGYNHFPPKTSIMFIDNVNVHQCCMLR